MIGVLGVNHKTAHIKIREAFYIADHEVIPLSELITQKTDVTEVVVLSTCNRTEIYFYLNKSCKNKTIKQITGILKDFKQIEENYESSIYTFTQRDAVKHLFETTSGVDSMVIGENQIVNQVKEFYLKSTRAALTGAILMRLFQKSFETSKRVRSETKIQQGATSVSYVAVDWCHQKLGDLSDKKIMLIGTGETGKIALNHLTDKGAKNFWLANRTFETARDFAQTYHGHAIPFEAFKEHLPSCDVVITATNAKDHLITKTDVEKYINGRRVYFVDLSVPRNIDEKIDELDNAQVVAVDDLQTSIDHTNQMRMESIGQAQHIIEQMANEYMEWFEQRKIRPVITTISKNLDKIHKKEIVNSKKFHSAEEIVLMEEYGDRLAQKYARNFIKQLKTLADKDIDDATMEKIKSLFLLHE